MLKTQDNQWSRKNGTRKSHFPEDGGVKFDVNNRVSKAFLKPNTTKKALTNLSSIVTEVKKSGLHQNQSPILMTTIDSDGIKSVTSAAGT